MRLTCLILLFFWSNLNAAETTDTFGKLLGHETLKYASVGVAVSDLTTGETLHAHNENMLMVPASVMKLVTSAAATSVLPSEWKFETTLKLNGQIKDDTLFGGFTIMANGDPSFCATESQYEELVTQVVAECTKRNIKYITDDVLVWPPVRPDATPQTWLFEDIGNYYGTAAHGFNFLENSYDFKLIQNEKIGSSVRASEEVFQLDEIIDITANNVTTGASGSGDQAYILGSPYNKQRSVLGTIPPGKGVFTIRGSVPNPEDYFAKKLRESLENQSITKITAPNRIGGSNSLGEIYSFSTPYRDIVETANFRSINLYAEALINSIGDGSRDIGINKVNKWLSKNDVDLDHLKMKDGSGLSVKNAVTAKLLDDVLRIKAQDESFKDLLPVSGVSGTMKYLSSAKIKGRFYAKSGSMDGVMNYAGYLKKEDGSWLAVSIIINNYTGSRYELRRAIVVWLDSLV